MIKVGCPKNALLRYPEIRQKNKVSSKQEKDEEVYTELKVESKPNISP